MCSDIYYFNPTEAGSIFNFCRTLSQMVQEYIELNHSKNTEVILLCVGSDRATGDCLGPIIGYKLSKLGIPNLHIYGTLEHPVHAQNLAQTIEEIQRIYPNRLIIAVDASLGSNNHIGFITLGKGALFPGIGVDKNLPSVGDIFITGIVNISGTLNQMLLQTTRLNLVMNLADHICMGIRYAFIHASVYGKQSKKNNTCLSKNPSRKHSLIK